MDQLENDEDEEEEQETLNWHELNVMELIDCIGKLVAEPSQTKNGLHNDHATPQSSDLAQATMKGQIVHRQLDIIDVSVTAIKRNVENPEGVVYVLSSYLDKIKSLEGNLERLKMEIVPLDEFRG